MGKWGHGKGDETAACWCQCRQQVDASARRYVPRKHGLASVRSGCFESIITAGDCAYEPQLPAHEWCGSCKEWMRVTAGWDRVAQAPWARASGADGLQRQSRPLWGTQSFWSSRGRRKAVAVQVPATRPGDERVSRTECAAAAVQAWLARTQGARPDRLSTPLFLFLLPCCRRAMTGPQALPFDPVSARSLAR